MQNIHSKNFQEVLQVDFWKKWLHIATAFILTLSLLSPAAVMAETEGLLEQTENELQQDNSNEDVSGLVEGVPGLGNAREIGLSEGKGYTKNAITEITLNPSGSLALTVGATQQLTVSLLPENTTQDTAMIVWGSSDASVATVVAGLVTAVGAGSAIITAEVDGVKAIINVENTPSIVTKMVTMRVEGYKGTIVSAKEFEVVGTGILNAADATKQVLDGHKITYKYSESTGYFSGINGEEEKALGVGSGWVYKINGSYPNVYAPDIEIENGDEIVWHYINSFNVIQDMEYYGMQLKSGAESVDKITFEPIIQIEDKLQQGEPIKLQISGKYNVLNYFYESVEKGLEAKLDNVKIEFNGKEYYTDENGSAVIPGEDVQAGQFELRFTKTYRVQFLQIREIKPLSPTHVLSVRIKRLQFKKKIQNPGTVQVRVFLNHLIPKKNQKFQDKRIIVF